VKPRKVKKLDPGGPLVENAARIIATRLAEMRSFAPAALARDASRDQHDLRIAAKRLRYVLEVTGFAFGRPADDARRRARDIQGVLGDLHDCDVMLPRIEAHIAALRRADAEVVRDLARGADDVDASLAARAPHRGTFRGLEVLAVWVSARRLLLHERFVELWTRIDREGTWTRLERALDRVVADGRERRAAARRAAIAERELAEAERAEREAAGRAQRAAEELAAARRAQAGAPEGAAPGPAVRPPLRRVQ
jgi:CHAD domain